MTNKRKQSKEEKQNSENAETKPIKPIMSPTAKKKKRTFRPFKDPVVTIIPPTDESNTVLDVNMVEAPAIVEENCTQNSMSCETLANAFSPLTAANTWELLQLRRMMDDPFLSSSRKQFMQNRILELYDTIINDILSQADSSDQNEFFVLEKLHSMAIDESLQSEQKQQAECILIALKDKVIGEVMKDASDANTDYDKTIDKLQALMRISWIPQEDKGRFIEKVMDLRGKLASGLSKQTHVPVEDGVKLLEKFRLLMKDPFLCRNSKTKLLRKVSYLRNTTISAVLNSEDLNQGELINTLNAMLQDPYLPYHKRLTVVNKIKGVEDRASKELKRCKLELKEKLMSSMEDVLGFEGTNLDFIGGYGIQNSPYVRCIHIWNPKTCDT